MHSRGKSAHRGERLGWRAAAHWESTRDVAERWFAALTCRDIADGVVLPVADVEWINYTPVAGYNDVMPWIGTYHGPDAVLASFKTFVGVCDPQDERLVKLAVDGEDAAGRHRRARASSGRPASPTPSSSSSG